ncbi:MAG: haloacid dehalogenase type II [Alphaproteobacteria bacterium]|nr:haloacid dehalogenase type II [Alphaproteobacteria bacterium]
MTKQSSTASVNVDACVFDAYGTLLDFASAAERCRDVLGGKTDALTALWRDKQLQYTWLRTLQGAHVDFWQVTQDSLDVSLDTLGLAEPALRTRLLDLYRNLDCFPEVPRVLRDLRAAGLPTAILSNGTPDMLAESIAHAGLSNAIDHVFSVEEIGYFKTHPAVYQLAVDRLATPANKIAFVSSNAWDAHAAAAFGMIVFWCNRAGQVPDRLPGTVYSEISDLSALPGLLCNVEM